MIDVPVHTARSRWQWESWARTFAGPAGIVRAPIGPGADVHVDALDGHLLGVLLTSETFDVRDTHDTFANVFAGDFRDGAVVRVDAGTAAQIARWAIGFHEAAHRERHWIDITAWRPELDAIRAHLCGGAVAADAAPPAPVTDDIRLRAEAAIVSGAPLPLGGVHAEGNVRIDPRYAPSSIADFRVAHTARDTKTGALDVRVQLRQGTYAPEVARVVALLVDESVDVVVAAAPFAAERAEHAIARLPIAPDRSLADLALWIVAAGTPMPNRQERATVVAIEAARRAARAARFGLDDLAERLLDVSIRRWSTIGHHPTRREIPTGLRTPYVGELAELAVALAGS